MAAAALFGGAFDPFHNGHLAICRAALSLPEVSELIVIPTFNAPHKNGFYADFGDRLAMARAALKELNCVVSDYEREKGGVSYSALTVEDFHRKYPEKKLYFVIGADSYRDLHKWYEPERITALATLAVFPRSGAELDIKPPAVRLDTGKIDVSSTLLRRLLSEGRDVSDYVPKAVEEYITEHNLYK